MLLVFLLHNVVCLFLVVYLASVIIFKYVVEYGVSMTVGYSLFAVVYDWLEVAFISASYN